MREEYTKNKEQQNAQEAVNSSGNAAQQNQENLQAKPENQHNQREEAVPVNDQQRQEFIAMESLQKLMDQGKFKETLSQLN